ncbi:MAG: hypothetical protein OXK21_02790, partial [Chloroflexota bacterium]|nr:hypothetical protein [Chloroflexota bacterium]
GLWSIDSESVTHARSTSSFEDYIAIDYSARSVNVVVRPTGGDPFPVIVTLDGEPVPVEHRGKDIAEDGDGNTVLNIDEARMFNVIQSPMQRRGGRRGGATTPPKKPFKVTKNPEGGGRPGQTSACSRTPSAGRRVNGRTKGRGGERAAPLAYGRITPSAVE